MLRELRLERDWTHEQAAEKMGVSRGQFIKLERGERRLTLEYIQQAARAFGVDPADVIGTNEPRRISLEEEWQEEQASIREEHKAYSRENYRPSIPGAIPEINVELGAGEGKVGEVITFPIGNETYSAHQVVDEWLLPLTYLERIIESHAGDTVVMPVVGDSMVPTYSPGDRVLVDLSQDRLTMDTVYAISDGFSPPQIKRLQRVMFSDPPEVIIISDNASHVQQTVPLDRLKIVGRIVGIVAKR